MPLPLDLSDEEAVRGIDGLHSVMASHLVTLSSCHVWVMGNPLVKS